MYLPTAMAIPGTGLVQLVRLFTCCTTRTAAPLTHCTICSITCMCGDAPSERTGHRTGTAGCGSALRAPAINSRPGHTEGSCQASRTLSFPLDLLLDAATSLKPPPPLNIVQGNVSSFTHCRENVKNYTVAKVPLL